MSLLPFSTLLSTVLLAKELQGDNILVNAYSPGWMKTDMGGENAPFTAEVGAETIVT